MKKWQIRKTGVMNGKEYTCWVRPRPDGSLEHACTWDNLGCFVEPGENTRGHRMAGWTEIALARKHYRGGPFQ